MSASLIVLMGPPGSGKTHLAEIVARRLALDHVEHEALLLERWGSREAFVANKAAALLEIEAGLRERLAASARGVLIETTGLSDRPMIERLATGHRIVVIRLDVSRELCATRVRNRPKGRHLDDSPESAVRFHDYWTREIATTWSCDAVIVNDAVEGDVSGVERTETIVETVRALLGTSGGPAGPPA